MSGMFRGLQIGVSALMAHQRAINVTSHNIANINTPGYQRQRANLREIAGPSGSFNPRLIGNGVYADGVNRVVTPFVDQQLRHQRGVKQYSEETETLLMDIETALIEPSDNGISANLDEFWQGWQDLAVSPTEPATRIGLLQNGVQLASTIKEAHGFISAMADNLDSQIGYSVTEIDDIAAELASLNKEILRANASHQGVGGGALPLEQRRDQLLFELSDLVDVTVSHQPNSISLVHIGNFALVDEGGAQTIELDENGQVSWTRDGRAVQATVGGLQALIDARDERVPEVLGRLDALAAGLAENVNALHRTGYGTNGETGVDFFVGDSALSLAVNADLLASPESVAAASQPDAQGDVSLALEISALSDATVMGDAPGMSLNSYHRSTVTRLGLNIQNARYQSDSAETIFNHLTDRRQSISGVSMDEEVANLLSYEKAFQAGARIINVMDEMLDQVINRMGLVGR